MKVFNKDFSFSILSFLKWSVIVGSFGATLLAAYILYVSHDLPNIDSLEEARSSRKVAIMDNKGEIITTYGDIYGYYVQYSEMPRNLVNAVLATEDRNFFSHHGVDFFGILRAAFANLRAGHTVQGGSTLTQQLAKIAFLTPTRSLKRKLQELVLAFELERKYTKQQIISIYLNRVYMGAGLYGIDSAAKYYFGKNVKDLSLNESAIIAGLLKAPSRFSPLNNPELTGNRTYQILLNMLEAGYINNQQLEAASNAPVALNTSLLGSKRSGYFTSWVYNNLLEYTNDETSDLAIKTTLDNNIQNTVQTLLTNKVNEIREELNVNQGAAVVLDYSGKILAIVGGTDFLQSSYNRAVQASRPTGSTFKTFVYTAALEKGYDPEMLVVDKPVAYKSWAPKNFNKKFQGEMTLVEAFYKSINTVAVQIAYKIGIRNVIELAHQMGIKSEIVNNLSSALGTSSLNLLELASAYGTIANDGYPINPYAVQYIKSSEGHKIIYSKPQIDQQRVLSGSTVNGMNLLLRSAALYGTARNANVSYLNIRGKTGTSQDFRDAWFVGFSDKYIVGVWLGNDDYSPTNKVTGGTQPSMLAKEIFKALYKNSGNISEVKQAQAVPTPKLEEAQSESTQEEDITVLD